ncbi:Putative nitroreductase HBN1 [Cladobotryum mycophilum]|uniref:Nitroreductase HBN1 n=1 Tax=Cladobotryum mycophilum TaxID=491253 RepID=A0ABR0SVU5_9HYPO
MAAKLAAETFFDLAKIRRSVYTLNKDIPITTSRVHEIVNQATLHTPSSFNSQSGRAVILFGAEHDKLWDITSDTLKAIVPPENWKPTGDKLSLFKGAAGSVLFFVDTDVVKGMQDKFPIYANQFPHWAVQSLGMQQYVTWTALEAEGLGANLQHYNPLIDEKVAQAWNVPAGWKLDAQLVFGGKTAEAGPKEFQPVEERVKAYGA